MPTAIKGKGVDTIAVTGVNDVFVMDAWKKASGADGKIEFLADGSADFAKALELSLDASAGGLGVRSKRYSMIVEDGVVSAQHRRVAWQSRSFRRGQFARTTLDFGDALKSVAIATSKPPHERNIQENERRFAEETGSQ